MREHQAFAASWLERNVLRRRLLFFTKTDPRAGEPPLVPKGFRVEKFSTREVVLHPDWGAWLPSAIAQAEGENFSLDTYLAFADRIARPVGAGSVLMVHHGAVWYDNVPMYRNEARLVGLSVLPEYRGQGLGGFLQRRTFSAANRNNDVYLVSAIVETHRVPSIRIHQGMFSNFTSNWLLKVAGRNVVSLVTGGEHKGLWYVGPGHNCRWRNEV